jgi:hypothetical protein
MFAVAFVCPLPQILSESEQQLKKNKVKCWEQVEAEESTRVPMIQSADTPGA